MAETNFDKPVGTEIEALNSQITPVWGNSGDIRWSKSAGISHVNLTGQVSLGTGGKIGTLPQGFRPNYNTYFLAKDSGNSTISPYLVVINTSGEITVYNRGDSISYLYGSCSFTIKS